jgi:hypothetical protein
MKRLLLIFQVVIVLLFIITSCTKSQFSTTVMQKRNGRTTYKNVYFTDKVKLTKTSSKGHNYKQVSKQSNYNIDRMENLHDEQVLIACNTTDQMILYNVNKSILKSSLIKPKNELKKKSNSTPDTIRAVRLNSGNNQYGYSYYSDNRVTEKLGLTGFILTLIGWLLVFGMPLSIIGVIFGSISLGKIRRNPGHFKGRGFAIASLILGVIGVVFSIVFLAIH